jgi:hypothetical protein
LDKAVQGYGVRASSSPTASLRGEDDVLQPSSSSAQPAADADDDDDEMGKTKARQRRRKRHEGNGNGNKGQGTGPGNDKNRVSYHGSGTIERARIYSVFSGDGQNETAYYWQRFVNGVNGSAYFDTLSQYFGSNKTTARWMQSYYVPSSNMTHLPCMLDAWNTVPRDIQSYICSLRTPLAGDVYAWFTSDTRPSSCDACGWHDWMTCDGVTIAVFFVYDLGQDSGCCTNCRLGVGPHPMIPEPAASNINIASHELAESMTDWQGTAWYEPDGEIADLCIWNFGTPVTLSNGARFNLQMLYSNAANGCVDGALL